MPNDCLVEGVETAPENNGVVLMPERLIFNKDNVADYDSKNTNRQSGRMSQSGLALQIQWNLD